MLSPFGVKHLLLIAFSFGFVSTSLALSDAEISAIQEFAAAFPSLQTMSYGRWNLSEVTLACSNFWYGITCNRTTDSITSMNFGSQLSGSLPPAIKNFTNLISFSAQYGNMNGTLPDELFQMNQLQVLRLAGNKFSGPIPAAFSTMTSLRVLDLSSNMFNGTIPSGFGALNNLEELNLGGADLIGPMPDWIGNMSSLKILTIRSRKFNGTLPASLGQLSKLEYINIYDGDLSGPIPPELSQPSLRDIDFSYNSLSGPLPESWATLKLKRVYLSFNQLNGTLPASYGSIKTLTDFHAASNLLTGTIPESWGGMTLLESLRLDSNLLEGSIPTSFGQLGNLTSIELARNQLSGPLPNATMWSRLRQLTTVSIDYNSFTGSPNPVFAAPNIRFVYIRYNQFSGPLDFYDGVPARLSQLYADNNRLSSISPLIGGMTQLSFLSLESNLLTGEIPSTIGNLRQLSFFRVANNFLTGDLPPTIHDIPLLSNLDVSNNSLSYCFVEPPRIASCNLRSNPNLCVCNRRVCNGNICANCTVVTNSTCSLPPRPNGFPTTVASRCESSISSTGYCCSSQCSSCQTCANGTCQAVADGPSSTCRVSCTQIVAGWVDLSCRTYQDDLLGVCSSGICNADSTRCALESRVSRLVDQTRSCGAEQCRRLDACQAGSPLATVNTTSSVCFVNERGRCVLNLCDLRGRCIPAEPPILSSSQPQRSSPTSESSRTFVNAAILVIVLATEAFLAMTY